jgi:hypothetical protein
VTESRVGGAARARDARAKFLDFYMLVLVLKNFARARPTLTESPARSSVIFLAFLVVRRLMFVDVLGTL